MILAVSETSLSKGNNMTEQQLRVYLEYTNRFDRIFEEFPIEGRMGVIGGYDERLARIRQSHSEVINRVMIRYFNLLSEEHYLHSQGLVEDQVWEMWTNLLRDALASELIRELWQNTRDSFRYYAPFVEYVNGLLPA
jgi:hypothetical protein